MDNDGLRFIFMTLVIVVPFFCGRAKDKIDKYFILYILGSLLGDGFTLFDGGYNLVIYSSIATFQLAVVSRLVYMETENKKGVSSVFILLILLFVFLYFTNHSSENVLSGLAPVDAKYPITLNQFFDFSAALCIGQIILAFIWLLHLVQRQEAEQVGIHKRYIYILALIVFY